MPSPTVEIEAFSASRLRLGYAFDNFLVFGAAGFSIAKANVDVTKTYTNKYVEQVRKTSGTNPK